MTIDDYCSISISMIPLSRYQGRLVSAIDTRVVPGEASATIILTREKLGRKGRLREKYPRIRMFECKRQLTQFVTDNSPTDGDFGPSLESPRRSARSSEIG